MNQLIICLVVFLLQGSMAILKVQEINYNNKKTELKKSMVNSFLMSIVSLLGLTIGISSVLKGDWFVALFFVGGSMFGKWLAFTKL